MSRRAPATDALRERGADQRSGRIAEVDLADHEATLLATALQLFYEHGFDGTSIERVARAARVSPKTIYGRFGGKSGLFFETMRRRSETILAPLHLSIDGEDGVRAALTAFATNLLTVLTQPEAIAIQRTIIGQAERFPELAATFYATGAANSIATLARFLTRADAGGFLRVAEPAVAAELLVGSIIGVPVRAVLCGGKRPGRATIAKRATAAIEPFLRAYATGRT